MLFLLLLAGCYTAPLKPDTDHSVQTKMVTSDNFQHTWNTVLQNLEKNKITVIDAKPDEGKIIVKKMVLIQPIQETVDHFARCGKQNFGFMGMVRIHRFIQVEDIQNGFHKITVDSNIIAQPVSYTGFNKIVSCYSTGEAERELLDIVTKGL